MYKTELKIFQGKGEMNTYWLVDSSRMNEKASSSSQDHIPGQVDRGAQAQAGTSQGEEAKDTGDKK